MTRARGFTLVEMLVALAIFAVLATMAYRGLETLLRASSRTTEHAGRLAALQRTFTLLQLDLEQAAPRPVRDELGDPIPALAGGTAAAPLVELTRAGRNGGVAIERPDIERVAWRLDAQRLSRVRWENLDRVQGDVPRAAVLLEGVRGVQVRFFSDGQWLGYWPPADGGGGEALPAAFEAVVTMQDGARYRRVILLPGAS
ncbi:MAG: type II secretion system minor pseudopilin GspJ [Gammaproteobacteria bacterium]